MLSLIPMVVMVPAMVVVLRGGRSSRTDRVWSRTRSSRRRRTGRRLLTESVEGSIFWNWNWRRSCRDHIITLV